MEQALAIDKKVHGDEHPDVACDLNNLAMLLKDQGKADEAEPFGRQAVAINKKTRGEDHQETLNAVGNLGLVLMLKSDAASREEGRAMAQSSLATLRGRVAPEHPWIAKFSKALADC